MAEAPEVCVDGAFFIAADGTWFHDGAPIAREALVRLFAGILQRDADGAYWLVTPAERVPITVEDAPFVAVELQAEGTGRGRVLHLRTNVGRWIAVDAGHPLIVRGGRDGPRPYLALGGGLEALVARPVYYDLAEMAEAGPDAGTAGPYGVWSAGAFFPLEPAGDEARGKP